jgi:hypothetical protein
MKSEEAIKEFGVLAGLTQRRAPSVSMITGALGPHPPVEMKI